MTFEQALQALKDGERVARVCWAKGIWVVLGPVGNLKQLDTINKPACSCTYIADSLDLLANDWYVVVEEGKPNPQQGSCMTSDDYERSQSEKKAKLILTLMRTGRFSYNEAIEFAENYGSSIELNEVDKYFRFDNARLQPWKSQHRLK